MNKCSRPAPAGGPSCSEPVKPPPPPEPCVPPKPPPRPPHPPSLFPEKLQKGDLLMLTILYLLLSEEEENDRLLPVIAIVLYLVMK